MVCGVKRRPHLGFLKVETISVPHQASTGPPLPWRDLKDGLKEILSVYCRQLGDVHVCSGFSGKCVFALAGTYSSFGPGRFSFVAIASSCFLFTL